ncbi:MAG: hypothetical protein WBN29_08815 [Polyangiales bacterium]
MRILIQTGGAQSRRSLGASMLPLLLAATLLFAAEAAKAQSGAILCSVTENAAPARGTASVEGGGKEIAAGSCGAALPVPAGKYKVTVRLDGTLDNPSKVVDVEVSGGKTAPVSVDFKTGALEVRLENKGQSGTGIVAVNRGSERIGTLGSGVAARLSAGKYEIVVRLGGQERRYEVDLRPGQRRLVRAQF